MQSRLDFFAKRPAKAASEDRPSDEDAGAPPKKVPKGLSTAAPSPAKKVAGVGKSSREAAEKHRKFSSNSGLDKSVPIPYSMVAEAFDRIGEDSKRLAKTQILTELMRNVIATTPEDLLPLVYLSVNRIAPAHEGVELGIGDATLIKALASTTGRKEAAIKAEYKESGDLGVVAQNSRSTQRTLFTPKPLMVRQVFAEFKAIATTEGGKSVERKMNIIKKLITSSKKSEASYIVRALQGKLRVGLAEQTVLTSLAQAVLLEGKEASKGRLAEDLEEAAQIVKQVYSECPSYDEMIPALLEHGVRRLPEFCKFTVGVPIKPMLAKPTHGVAEVLEKFDGEEFTCEYKYDGERAQIHIKGDTVKIFSRNAEDNTSKYPEITEETMPKVRKDSTLEMVIDGEVVAYDPATKAILPFKFIMQRKKKDASMEDVKIPACVFAFDCLYLNGKSLLQSTLVERREALYSACNEIEGRFFFATSKISTDVNELQVFLDDSIREKTEGLIVKSMESTYEPSKRSLNWLKLKKDYMDACGDSMDLVVLGAWHGKGKRKGVYGTFLLGCYNDDTEEYETCTKVGTGFSEEDLESHHKALQEHIIECPRPYYKWEDKMEPDVWFNAAVVWEVRAADLTVSPVHRAAVGLADEEKGIALRFPRFLNVREDRPAHTATKSTEIYDLYRNQPSVKAECGDDSDDE